MAADAICNDSARVICSQKQIVSDQGVSTVAGGFARRRFGDRPQLKQRALQNVGTRDLRSLTNSQLSEMAKLLHVDGWRCYVSILEICRTQIAERIAEYASREAMLFDDERSKLSQALTLREIERMRTWPIYKKYVEFVRKDAATFRKSPALESQLRSMFPEMVQTFIATVREWPVPEPQKSRMIERLRTLTFTLDLPEKCSKDVPAPYVPNGNYNASANRVAICSGLFIASTSPSSLAVIVAHEIAHTVGPCFFPTFSPAGAKMNTAALERVYGGLLSCLEDRNGQRAPLYCAKNSKVNESFADWAGADLAAKYLPRRFPSTEPAKWRSRFAGVWSFECGEPGDDAHPANIVRFNQLLFANPRVRSLVNCPRAPERECQLGSPVSKRNRAGARARAKAVK